MQKLVVSQRAQRAISSSSTSSSFCIDVHTKFPRGNVSNVNVVCFMTTSPFFFFRPASRQVAITGETGSGKLKTCLLSRREVVSFCLFLHYADGRWQTGTGRVVHSRPGSGTQCGLGVRPSILLTFHVSGPTQELCAKLQHLFKLHFFFWSGAYG